MSMNKLLQRVYLKNIWEDDRGVERKKIYKTITDSRINQHLLSLIFFPPEIGRDHYHHSCHLLGTPCMQTATKHFLLLSTKEIRHLILSFHGLALIGKVKDIVGKS